MRESVFSNLEREAGAEIESRSTMKYIYNEARRAQGKGGESRGEEGGQGHGR